MDEGRAGGHSMVKSVVYIEGGGRKKAKPTNIACRRAFRRLFERSGFADRMPRLVASGSRNQTYSDFKVAHENSSSSDKFIAMLVDSEDPLDDIEKTWGHLKSRDKWAKPDSAKDDQVFFMTTSMETWIATDRQSLRQHYGANLRESSLPDLYEVESRSRDEVFKALKDATRDHSSPYDKGRISFDVLEVLNPDVLKQHLPSFTRMLRILDEKL